MFLCLSNPKKWASNHFSFLGAIWKYDEVHDVPFVRTLHVFWNLLSKPLVLLHSRLLLHLILSLFFFCINSCSSRLSVFLGAPPPLHHLSASAPFSARFPHFIILGFFRQPWGTRSVISKQFITRSMFWVQYPRSVHPAAFLFSFTAAEWVFPASKVISLAHTRSLARTRTHCKHHFGAQKLLNDCNL